MNRQIIYNIASRIWIIRNIGEGRRQINSLINIHLFAMLGFWKVTFNLSMSDLKCIMPVGGTAPKLRVQLRSCATLPKAPKVVPTTRVYHS